MRNRCGGARVRRLAAAFVRVAARRAAPILAVVVVSWPTGDVAAQTHDLAGRVRTAAGEPVARASVAARAPGDTAIVARAATDEAGRFRLGGLASGGYVVRVEHAGYGVWTDTVRVPLRQPLDVRLLEDVVPLPALEVVGRPSAAGAVRAGATVHSLQPDEIRRIPGLAESDVLRAVEVLPGVVTTSDFTAAFNVRGGSADQNLILLDGIPLYNPFHLGGIFSVFNADMVARTDLWTGGFPARFGGRVSSVLSIESDPGADGFRGDAGISLLSTRLAIGGHAPAGLSQALGAQALRGRLSVRRSYFDQVLRPFVDFPYHLTDVQGYGEARLHGGLLLGASGYTGRDVIDLRGFDEFPLRMRWRWGNDAGGLRALAPAGSGAVDAVVGASRFITDIRFPDFDDTEFRGRIDHLLLRVDGEWPIGAQWLATGIELGHLSYDNLARSGGTRFVGGAQSAWQPSAYVQLDARPGDGWLLEAGFRADGWAPSRGESALELSPRLAAKRFLAGGDAAVKLAIGRYTQFVHSVRDEELPLGIDFWVLAGERAPHVVSDQVQAGVELFAPDPWFASAEVFARRFRGVIATNAASDPNDPLDDIVTGDGLSYGADLAVRRSAGRLRPALAASWLRAWREFPEIRLSGAEAGHTRYPPVFDRRFDLDLLLLAPIPRGWDLGVRLNYGTGLPYTRPLASYALYEYSVATGLRAVPEADGLAGVLLGPRNAERYPAYVRLDVSARRRFTRSWGSFTPYLEVLNVTNRRNVLFYFYELDRDPPVRSGFSMFPLLPTFGMDVVF